ncbi:MAG: D-arabinono-1,4-lactone oxidase [Jatrophihabitans sp.]
MTDWTNWAGNQRAAQVHVAAPRSTDELVAAVRAATARGERIKPIGAGHSFTGIGHPEHVQLRLDHYARLVRLDRDTRLVTVQAGMPLHRLNRFLAEAGLSLTNLGDIDRQTIAGAVSTGTHGTGARFGGLATQLRGLEMVLADGTLLSASTEENADVFTAARVGLGALGVLSTVTLQAEPQFAMHAHEGPMPLGAVLADLDELADTTDHFEFYWFPHTERTLVKRNTRLPWSDEVRGPSRLSSWWNDELLNNIALGAAVGLGKRVPRAVPGINSVVTRLLGDRTFTDVSHQVFTSPRRVRFVEMEYAVPRAELAGLVRAIKHTIETRGWPIAFPIEVRVAAADDIPLSTASGRASGYVAVHVPAGQEHETYFRAVEQLAGEVGGRPHWGKLHYLDAATLRERYPRFDEFVALRDRLDPRGVFSNAYLDRVLGCP